VTYCGSDKKRFQLEIPDSFTKKAGKDYELQGQRKGFKRYWTSETKVDVLSSFLFIYYLGIFTQHVLSATCSACPLRK
jgi:hypothetical protein